ncbi:MULTISPECIES: thiol-disulfide oxidoreductase DCC family protein [Streptomyces]|nr:MULTISPECIES: hypothetical protein [Streptomyces]
MAERPILLFDGDRDFCTKAVNTAVRPLDTDADITPWQFADLETLGVTAEKPTARSCGSRPTLPSCTAARKRWPTC